ncbi:hypothetical protein AVEN_261580-1 [Araneus ventricosus]|uniref:Uncharacterized protein n=1 Tax=Araneus ventricosus TaxID=182803 RepID=A0A4Y2EC94_ARAVE|nr:hypothetical protein AVEN_261580-1 [Araneus ventricosus]
MGSQRCWNLLDIFIRRGDTLDCTRSFHVTSRPAEETIEGERLGDGGNVDRLGSPSSANVFGVLSAVRASKLLDTESNGCDRYGISDRTATSFASAVLQDIGIVHEGEASHVVDRNKIRRQRKKL